MRTSFSGPALTRRGEALRRQLCLTATAHATWTRARATQGGTRETSESESFFSELETVGEEYGSRRLNRADV